METFSRPRAIFSTCSNRRMWCRLGSRWSPILLRPEGLYGTRPAEGGNKAAKLKAIREAVALGQTGVAGHRLRSRGSADRSGDSRALPVPRPDHAGAVHGAGFADDP